MLLIQPLMYQLCVDGRVGSVARDILFLDSSPRSLMGLSIVVNVATAPTSALMILPQLSQLDVQRQKTINNLLTWACASIRTSVPGS